MKEMHKHISKIALAVLFAGAGSVVCGQTSSHLSSDAHFAAEAASGGMAEVKLGQLAQQNGSSDAVKEFGKRMETDHSKAGDQLKEIASKNNITLPTDLNSKDQVTYGRLAKLSGAEFDRAYAQDMVTDHVQDIAAFKREANSGTNPDVKDFASQTLPTLEDHLKHAREMEKSLGIQSLKSKQ
jgi:putative membrane protein